MANGDIIFHTGKLHVYELIVAFGQSLGYTREYIDETWEGVVLQDGLYEELCQYLFHHELSGHFSFEGYTIYDVYFYELRSYNLHHDIGKNPSECDKDCIIFQAFHTMVALIKDPETYKEKLQKGMGVDYL